MPGRMGTSNQHTNLPYHHGLLPEEIVEHIRMRAVAGVRDIKQTMNYLLLIKQDFSLHVAYN